MNHLLSSPLRRAALRMPVRRACLANVRAMSSTPTEGEFWSVHTREDDAFPFPHR